MAGESIEATEGKRRPGFSERSGRFFLCNTLKPNKHNTTQYKMSREERGKHNGFLVIDPGILCMWYSICDGNLIADFRLCMEHDPECWQIMKRYSPDERLNSGSVGPVYESVYISHKLQFGHLRPSLGEYYDVSKLGVPEQFQWLFDLLGSGVRLFYTWDKQDYPAPQREKKRKKEGKPRFLVRSRPMEKKRLREVLRDTWIA